MRKRLGSTAPLIAILAAATLAAVLAWPRAALAQSAPAIIEALKAGDLEAARTLVVEGADVNLPQGDGATALHWAAHRNDLDAATLLIEAGADVEVQPLGQGLHHPGDADLVDHLGELAGPGRTHQGDRLAVAFYRRPGALEGRRVAADHDRQSPVLGPGLAAGDRRVEEIEALFTGLGVKLGRPWQRWWCCRSGRRPPPCRRTPRCRRATPISNRRRCRRR